MGVFAGPCVFRFASFPRFAQLRGHKWWFFNLYDGSGRIIWHVSYSLADVDYSGEFSSNVPGLTAFGPAYELRTTACVTLAIPAGKPAL